MRKQIFLALLAVLALPLVGRAADANNVDHPADYYTTDNSYKHGIKAEPSDTTANSLNAKQSEFYKPREEQSTVKTIVTCRSEGQDPKSCTTAVKLQ